MIRLLENLHRRFWAHLKDIDNHLEYPDMLSKPLPTGIDVRGEYEMELHWEYRRKLLAKRADFPLIDDCESAGWQPHALEPLNNGD